MYLLKNIQRIALAPLNWLLLLPVTVLAIFCIYGVKWGMGDLLLMLGRKEAVPQIILAVSIAVIVLQIWWILSDHFTKINGWLFWGCLGAVFAGINVFLLCYFSMMPTIGDDVIYLKSAKILIAHDTWANICWRHSYGNAYHLRSLWCWYLPFKIFGTSAYVYKIFNCLFQLGTAIGLYWICKECFHNLRISRGAVVVWLLSPIVYLSNQGGGSEMPGIFWGVLFSGFGLALIRRLQRFPFWGGKSSIPWSAKEYLRIAFLVSGALLCFIFVNNSRQIGIFYIAAIFGLIFVSGAAFLITRFNRRKIAFPIALLILWGGIFAAGLWIPNRIFSLDLSKHQEFSDYRVDSSAWVWIVNMPAMGSRDQNIMRALSQEMPQSELRRQQIHHVFLIPLFEGENTTRQIHGRLTGLNDFYKEMTVLFKTDDKQKNQLFQELINNTRSPLWLFVAAFAFFGLIGVARMGWHSGRCFLLIFFNCGLLFFLLFLGEPFPRVAFLMYPYWIVFAAVGLFACYELKHGRWNHCRFRGWPWWMVFWATVPWFALAFVGSPLYHAYSHDIDFRTAEKIFPQKNGELIPREKICRRACQDFLFLEAGVPQGCTRWQVGNLSPGKPYIFSAFLKIPVIAETGYQLQLQANSVEVYSFDSTKDKALVTFPALEHPLLKRGDRALLYLKIPVKSDENGKFDFCLKLTKTGKDNQLWYFLFNCELLPGEMEGVK